MANEQDPSVEGATREVENEIKVESRSWKKKSLTLLTKLGIMFLGATTTVNKTFPWAMHEIVNSEPIREKVMSEFYARGRDTIRDELDLGNIKKVALVILRGRKVEVRTKQGNAALSQFLQNEFFRKRAIKLTVTQQPDLLRIHHMPDYEITITWTPPKGEAEFICSFRVDSKGNVVDGSLQENKEAKLYEAAAQYVEKHAGGLWKSKAVKERRKEQKRIDRAEKKKAKKLASSKNWQSKKNYQYRR